MKKNEREKKIKKRKKKDNDVSFLEAFWKSNHMSTSH